MEGLRYLKKRIFKIIRIHRFQNIMKINNLILYSDILIFGATKTE